MLQNITIDSTNTSAIHLYPPLCDVGGWTVRQTQLAEGGSYCYCSGFNFARAELKFTGVAVYLLGVRDIIPDTMFVSLDDGEAQQVSLVTTTGQPMASDILWSTVNLPNAVHVLDMYPGAYNGSMGFVTVDAFIITTSDEPIVSAPVVVMQSSSDSSSNAPIAIGVGVALGVVVLMLLGVAAWMFMNKRKNAIPLSPGGQSTQPFLVPSPNVDPQMNMTQFTPYTDYRQSSVVPDPAMALYSGTVPDFNKPAGTGVSPSTAFV